MNDHNHTAWTRLVAAARRAPVPAAAGEEIVVPSGFATRIVAHAGLRPGGAAAVGLFGAGFDRLAARALGLACAFAVAFAIWGSMPATAEARSTDAAATITSDAYLDPVGDYIAAVQSSS